MRFTRTLGIAGALIVAALVGGTLIGSAMATAEPADTDSSSAQTYCDAFIDALASDLGVTRESLVAAGRSAANAAADAAVEAGDLSEARADALREQIAEDDGSGCGWFGRGFGRGFGHGLGIGLERGIIRGLAGADVLGDAGEVLGLETSELLDAAREAGSLEAVAVEQGVAYDEVRAAVLASVQKHLDEAVADGLSQERADAALDRLTAWLDGGGELPTGGRGGFGPGRGHGPGQGWGWHDRDDSDDADAEEPGA